MCLVVYVASRSPLPLIPWDPNAPAFHVEQIAPEVSGVARHFSLPCARYAGSHTSCGCGFNEGREYVGFGNESESEEAALKSAESLARYVRANQVGEVYACWSGDEMDDHVSSRRVEPDQLAKREFVFKERELLLIDHSAS